MRYSVWVRFVHNMIEQNLMEIQAFFEAHPLLGLALVVWSLLWKGLALWKSARLSHKVWFIVMLVANTVGILEIVYLFFIAKKYDVRTEIETTDADTADKQNA